MFKALFFSITLLHFLKLIDWQMLSHLLCDNEQDCFYDISGVGHVNSENESHASSSCTLRYDWFVFASLIKIILPYLKLQIL